MDSGQDQIRQSYASPLADHPTDCFSNERLHTHLLARYTLSFGRVSSWTHFSWPILGSSHSLSLLLTPFPGDLVCLYKRGATAEEAYK